MKLAVPTQDGTSISQHFGRSKSFFVFEVDDGKIAGRSVRDNTFTAHAKGECREGEHHGHGHGDIVEALKDCEAVLCYGMGWRAAEALQEGGVNAFILQEEMSPEEAVTNIPRAVSGQENWTLGRGDSTGNSG
jgi:predicted Fe-Mo cluster-binding NifX family protein